MDTLLLAQDTWDLCLDINGNIAVAANPYSEAQDVASSVRLFIGELWFDIGQGIPYFENILGQRPNIQFIKSRVEAEALRVPGVVQARCLFASIAGRTLRGQVQIIDDAGQTNNVSF